MNKVIQDRPTQIPTSISQIELVVAILREIDRQNPGCTGTQSIYHAITQAADQIVSAIREAAA